MKHLKSHLFLVLALVSILFSIETYFIFSKIVLNYEKKIAKNYTMLIVSKTKITGINFANISKIEELDISENLKNIKVSMLDLKKIREKLPYFYKIHFNKFPNPEEVKEIEQFLLDYPNITRVETFRESQTQTYDLLLIIKLISKVFMIVIFFISFLLVTKQLEVWRFEHSERMYIMELFGAPLLFRSLILLKLAIIDSIISIFVMFGIIETIINSEMYNSLLNKLSIQIDISIFYDLSLFFIIALLISICSTLIVIFSKRDDLI